MQRVPNGNNGSRWIGITYMNINLLSAIKNNDVKRKIRFTKPALTFLIVFFTAYLVVLGWLAFDMLEISSGDLL